MPPRPLIVAAIASFVVADAAPLLAQPASAVVVAQAQELPPPGEEGQDNRKRKNDEGSREQQQRRGDEQGFGRTRENRKQERRKEAGEEQSQPQKRRKEAGEEQFQPQKQRRKQAEEEQRQRQRSATEEEQQRQQKQRRQQAEEEERRQQERQRQRRAEEEQQRRDAQEQRQAVPGDEERQRERRGRERQQVEDQVLPGDGRAPAEGEAQGDRRKRAEDEMRRKLKERRDRERQDQQAEPGNERRRVGDETIPPVAAEADPRKLSDRDLRRRVRQNQEGLERQNISQEDRARLEERHRADREELTRRVRASTGQRLPDEVIEQPRRAREEARTIMADRRPARGLSEEDLRSRVTRNRSLLAVEGLSEEDRRDLRERLADDREELRQRAALDRREDRSRDGDPDTRRRPPDRFGNWDDDSWDRDSDRRGWDDALTDRRPARTLSERELNRRIRATRHAMERGYGGIPRSRLEARLREDRRELRRRMRDWRYERDDWWDDYDDDVNVSIGIMIIPNQPPMWRPPIEYAEVDDVMLQEWLVAPPTMPIERQYTVAEIEQTPTLRQAMPGIEIDTIQFGFNEDFVPEEEVGELSRIGEILEGILRANPSEIFLIEGHTDAVGSDGYNLGLSQRRADSVKGSLTQYFNIRPENLETVGYGEQFLKIPTPEEEPENRRVTIRRITPLVGQR